jgi:folate-binding Fe-S cluster repair protein YgfZ
MMQVNLSNTYFQTILTTLLILKLNINLLASLPFIEISPIWLTSNIPTSYLTALCSSLIHLTDTKAQYTALCNEEGGIIDDLVTYKIGDNDYLLNLYLYLQR